MDAEDLAAASVVSFELLLLLPPPLVPPLSGGQGRRPFASTVVSTASLSISVKALLRKSTNTSDRRRSSMVDAPEPSVDSPRSLVEPLEVTPRSPEVTRRSPEVTPRSPVEPLGAACAGALPARSWAPTMFSGKGHIQAGCGGAPAGGGCSGAAGCHSTRLDASACVIFVSAAREIPFERRSIAVREGDTSAVPTIARAPRSPSRLWASPRKRSVRFSRSASHSASTASERRGSGGRPAAPAGGRVRAATEGPAGPLHIGR